MKKITAYKKKMGLSDDFLEKLDKADPDLKELIFSLLDELWARREVEKKQSDEIKNTIREIREMPVRSDV